MANPPPLTPEQITAGIPERQFLVKAARELERLLARRRKQVKVLAEIDDAIRVCRSQIHGLTSPLPTESDTRPLGGEPDLDP